MSPVPLLVALGPLGDLLAAPSPSDGQEMNSVTVSPGLGGFFAMFVLAAAMVLLLVDMTRRTRRVQARARVEARHAEEDARRAAEEQGAASGKDAAPGAPEDGADGTEPTAEERADGAEPTAEEGPGEGPAADEGPEDHPRR